MGQCALCAPPLLYARDLPDARQALPPDVVAAVHKLWKLQKFGGTYSPRDMLMRAGELLPEPGLTRHGQQALNIASEVLDAKTLDAEGACRVLALANGGKVERASLVFAALDRDSSGTLDVEELRIAVRAMAPTGRTRRNCGDVARGIMRIADLDGNGTIDRREFLQMQDLISAKLMLVEAKVQPPLEVCTVQPLPEGSPAGALGLYCTAETQGHKLKEVVLRVDGVESGGPAEKLGIKPGCVIKDVAGAAITTFVPKHRLPPPTPHKQRQQKRLMANGLPIANEPLPRDVQLDMMAAIDRALRRAHRSTAHTNRKCTITIDREATQREERIISIIEETQKLEMDLEAKLGKSGRTPPPQARQPGPGGRQQQQQHGARLGNTRHVAGGAAAAVAAAWPSPRRPRSPLEPQRVS